MRKIPLILVLPLLSSCFLFKIEKKENEEQGISPVITNDIESVFVVVETMPEFPGGQDSLSSYLNENLSYPEKAIKNKTEGKVYVQFIVEKEGSISEARVLRGIGSGCDQESLRVVNEMPKWKPGTQRGKPVRVRFVLPLNYQLPKKTNSK